MQSSSPPEKSQPETGLPPKKRKWLVPFAIGVAVVIVVAIIVAYYVFGVNHPPAQQAATKPIITIVGASYTTSGCGESGPYVLLYTWTVNLTNTGDANGFATLTYYINGNAVAHTDEWVPQGMTILIGALVQGATQSGWPCAAETATVAITAVTNA